MSWAAGAVAGGLSLSAHAQDLALSGADLSPETFRHMNGKKGASAKRCPQKACPPPPPPQIAIIVEGHVVGTWELFWLGTPAPESVHCVACSAK